MLCSVDAKHMYYLTSQLHLCAHEHARLPAQHPPEHRCHLYCGRVEEELISCFLQVTLQGLHDTQKEFGMIRCFLQVTLQGLRGTQEEFGMKRNKCAHNEAASSLASSFNLT